MADKVKTDPRRPGGSNIPDGRYAFAGADGSLRFVRVRVVADGKWEGWTFADQLVGGGADGSLVKEPLNKAQQTWALRRIADEGWEACGQRFAHSQRACARCGRGLSVAASRLAGFGPDCREALGIPTPTKDDLLAAGFTAEQIEADELDPEVWGQLALAVAS